MVEDRVFPVIAVLVRDLPAFTFLCVVLYQNDQISQMLDIIRVISMSREVIELQQLLDLLTDVIAVHVGEDFGDVCVVGFWEDVEGVLLVFDINLQIDIALILAKPPCLPIILDRVLIIRTGSKLQI